MIVRKTLIRAFGRNVKRRRKLRKWRQVDLARQSHLKLMTVNKIERGATNARLSTVESLALAFRCEPTELLNRLSAREKTLEREEEAFISEGWKGIDHGRNLVQAFGANVRWHRNRQKLTQVDLARMAHVRVGTVSEIELAKTNPRVSTVESMALALQIDPTFLIRRPSAKPGDESESRN